MPSLLHLATFLTLVSATMLFFFIFYCPQLNTFPKKNKKKQPWNRGFCQVFVLYAMMPECKKCTFMKQKKKQF